MESRTQRMINVAILVGVLALVSGMVAVPRDGPSSYFDAWLTRGLPLLAVGLVAVALRAPKYIRGGRS